MRRHYPRPLIYEQLCAERLSDPLDDHDRARPPVDPPTVPIRPAPQPRPRRHA